MSERRAKYGSRKAPCSVCHATHDSQRERVRCWELDLRERLGEIRYLRRQVRYRLDVNGEHVCDYVADFVYSTPTAEVIEDCKGYRTREYLIKRKLMRAVHGVDIRET